ncbi:glutamate mutase subunit E [Herbihabitans rhizosphaerae]|uniref:Glutamate mutase subunit E n=1 Tax=Herbihabitans rhizosphaerae TaxID=1872711 RepID=A0A4Q7KGL6_9PSEU|nr:methylaspartate mutase [Herbihabitans rhizosphaerae]RZS32716.1 glutamate mutase subunit E [Herbihabitans rhizosphaerae]
MTVPVLGRGGFGDFVARARTAGELVVQPRMGFSDPVDMRAGLQAVKAAGATTVGTLTLDSYTRVGDLRNAEKALSDGVRLNGYPIVNYDEATTRAVLAGVRGTDFPVQVRHGSAVPLDIFAALMRAGIDATEGGPVSYCLPYGRTPLDESVRNWTRCCELFVWLREFGMEPHLETFGGCMMGQLCPPSQLVAISALEALFFYRFGIRSISASYAQQTNMEQDREAVAALRRLCAELLPAAQWHVVIYGYMGVYPASDEGAYALLGRSAELAVASGSERLIVKTVAEARRIPTIEENVSALEFAAGVAHDTDPADYPAVDQDSQVYAEARALVDAVLDLDDDLGRALLLAFKRGYLDIPYCLHPDNMGSARSYIDDDGRLRWAELGSLPLGSVVDKVSPRKVASADLLTALSYVRHTYDDAALEHAAARTISGTEHVLPRKQHERHGIARTRRGR